MSRETVIIKVGILMLFSVLAALSVALVLGIIDQYGEFEYTTSSGETGTASFCTVSYGASRCRTDNGTTIMVERYTKLNKQGGEE